MVGTMADVAAYWNRRPCNCQHSCLDPEVQPLAYSLQVKQRKFAVEPHLLDFADPVRWKGKRVLDLGCGIGTESLVFALNGAEVVGLDLSRASIDLAIRRATAEGLLGRCQFGVWNMEDRLPAGDRDAYDLVWAWGSVHHTPHPGRAVWNAANCLKPGGELRLMVYHRLSTKALRLWALAGFPRDFDAAVARHSEAQPDCPVTHTYTRRMARHLVEGPGLVVESVRVAHIFPWQGDPYGRHEYRKGLPWRWTPGWLFRLLERTMGWHLLVVGRREGL